jgi:hypothetical protein
MRRIRNIDLRSVRPAEWHCAADRQQAATIHEDSGQTARWAHRQNAYVPIFTNSHERTRPNQHGESSRGRGGDRGTSLTRNRYSSHLEVSFESRSTFVRSLTSFGMTEERRENEILR